MARPAPRAHPQAPKELDRYLIPSEQIIFMTRRHWVVLFGPIALVLGWLVVVVFFDQSLNGPSLRVRDLALLIWFGLVLRLAAKFTDWYRERFLATDRRLMLVSGIVTRQVDIMPMSKVTDMRYDRTVTGQLLGYGVYIMESAGQEQALQTINFIPQPDLHYKQISAVIFAPDERQLPGNLIPAATGSKIPITEPDQAWWRRT
jgi:hypothetical protein